MIDIVAAALIAALAGMGIGGGGLLVLYLVIVRGMGQVEAQGLNLVFFVFAAASSLLYHMKKRKLDGRLWLILVLFGVPGAYMGALTAGAVSPAVIRRFFGWLLMVSGAAVFFKRKEGRKKKIGKK